VQLLDWQHSKLHGRQIVVLGNMEGITQLITSY
jgi:fructose-1,6-bisphosphatase